MIPYSNVPHECINLQPVIQPLILILIESSYFLVFDLFQLRDTHISLIPLLHPSSPSLPHHEPHLFITLPKLLKIIRIQPINQFLLEQAPSSILYDTPNDISESITCVSAAARF